ncbi:LuxR family transcriptional regulator [Pedobacter chinensis]|uniref:LuxR family transcriptional regulator n=1 Tax=Pedobacter chinensis TaxID=2282421 RepID=A0A369Q2W2_9SPHI|nr:helix-turn-helix transcriptional regulator [Pedobacter chinensis]RDC57279.1 LuxR family transcriptional regulator [Pedobacter chinensis]
MAKFNNPNLTPEMCSKINSHIQSFNSIPGVVILHDLRDWHIAYMSDKGLNQLGTTLEEVCALPSEIYHAKYFNPDDALDYVPKIGALMENNKDCETVSFYQQIRFPNSPNWNWYLSSIKIFMRDADEKPLMTITVSIPVDAMHHMAVKAERNLEENNFSRNNSDNFLRLSKREKTILREMALGKSSIEIANELCISSTTVDTHRRNIREKLNTKSSFEISKYARAFDLI